ncbi:Uncharacterised protein [Mycobacteroides abscessus subsp. abscessus]|nr:Uncharacterised protein [Mycobacteroides abscessus subsp. abscessus]
MQISILVFYGKILRKGKYIMESLVLLKVVLFKVFKKRLNYGIGNILMK